MFNPFITDRPAPIEELIDRERAWRDLLDRAEGGHSSRLSAPRRYGKTTLLKKLLAEADLLGLRPVYVDFYGVISSDEVLQRIEHAYGEALQGSLGRWFTGMRRKWRPTLRIGTQEAGLDLHALPEDDALRALQEALDLPKRIFEREGSRSLVVFDEFQELLAAEDQIDGLVRSRIQHHGDAASYVFSGSHPGLMAELFGSKARPLFAQARPLVLAPLPDEELAEYVGDRFDRTGKDVGDALGPLLDVARGHPQRAMALAHHLWERTVERGTADEGAWAEAFGAAMDELRDEFEGAWMELSTNERRVLAAVAWCGRWGQGDSLFSKSTLQRFRLSKGSARDVRDSLIRRGELERVGEAGTRIVDPLLEAWIASGRRPRY